MKNSKLYLALLLVTIFCAALLCGCGNDSGAAVPEDTATKIELTGDGAIFTGGGVAVNGSVVTISAAGEYSVSGTLDNGQIVINTGDEAMKVTLTLNNASITCLDAPAIMVEKADKLKLVLADGSENTVISGVEGAAPAADASGAAIFSKDDLDIEGSGKLTVNGYINNGIASKDDLKVQGGFVTVTAVNNGLRGADSVQIEAGTLVISAGNDGIKSATTDKVGKGFITVSGGDVTVSASGDGIDAATTLDITGGRLCVDALGDGVDASSKALKAETSISISGGELELNSIDAAVRCVADVNISGGSIYISSAADGIQAGKNINGFPSETGTATISGGSLFISSAKRAIDAKDSLSISGGTVFALSGSKKALEAGADGQPYVSYKFSGSAGNDVQFGELATVTAKYDFTSILFSSPELASGTEYTVTCGQYSETVTAW